MDIGMVIGSSIVVFTMTLVTTIYFKTKDRKETLNIWVKGDSVKLLLSDQDYAEFNIADIKNNKTKINEELVKFVKARAKVLVQFVDRVTFFKNGDEKFEKELLSIILQAKG